MHRKKIGFFFWFVVANLLLPAVQAAEAGSMRCDGRLVSVGDRRFDAIAACGEPDLRVPVRLEVVGSYPLFPLEEIWYYNFGPHRLIKRLRLRRDRITAIESGNYGFHPEYPGSCRPEDLRTDMTSLEVLARCGEPHDLEHRPRYRSHVPRIFDPYGTVVLEEQWVYDFGPQRFYRVLTVIDGRVARIEIGRR